MLGIISIIFTSAVATKAFIAKVVRSRSDLLCLKGGDEELCRQASMKVAKNLTAWTPPMESDLLHCTYERVTSID